MSIAPGLTVDLRNLVCTAERFIRAKLGQNKRFANVGENYVVRIDRVIGIKHKRKMKPHPEDARVLIPDPLGESYYLVMMGGQPNLSIKEREDLDELCEAMGVKCP